MQYATMVDHITVEPTDAQNTTTDDTNTNMTLYDALETADVQDKTTSDYSWGDHPGQHTTVSDAARDSIGDVLDGLDDNIDGDVADVLEEAYDAIPDSSEHINDFQCDHPKCGLDHGHHPGKHDITNSVDCAGIEGFGVTSMFADQMEFVRNCHCGASEMAMLVRFMPHIAPSFGGKVFSDGEKFRAAFQLDTELVNEAYRKWQAGASVLSAISDDLETQMNLADVSSDELSAWFDRREHIEDGGSNAPIGQETQEVINDLEARLETVTGN